MTLYEMRIESGYKAQKIAEFLGISRVQFYNLERGRYKMDDNKIVKLCEVYKKTRGEILAAIEEVNVVNDRK